MAEVFLGRQAGMEGFEKLVVLKRIRPEFSREDNFVKMFLNEARIAARLNHPNIVQIFELGKVEQQYFIAMEFIHGEDIKTITRQAEADKKHPSTGLMCRMIADTLAGLHYAHTRQSSDGKLMGLVHRDVSPQNVLVTYEGSVKLVDFGIAKATHGGLTEQTRAGLFKGKFAYMSPEQSRGAPLDARSDVFAVGILLWELLTWTRLFKRANDMATLIAVAEEEIPSVRSFDSRLPVELEQIVMKALDRRVHMRYQSAQDMRADLEALIRNKAWEADSLVLRQYMHDLFAAKIKSQEEDIRESGFGSLEDFLLTVDEASQISWIKSVSAMTPSGGLPSQNPPSLPGLTDRARDKNDPLAHAHTAEHELPREEVDPALLGDLAEPGFDDLPGEATSFSTVPVFEDEGPSTEKGAQRVHVGDPKDLPLAHAGTAPVAEVPKLPAPASLTKKPTAKPQLFAHKPTMPPISNEALKSTLPPGAVFAQRPAPTELPAVETKIVDRPELQALPTAIVAPPLQPTPRPASTPVMTASTQSSVEVSELAPPLIQIAQPPQKPQATQEHASVAPMTQMLAPAVDPMAITGEPMTPIDRGSTAPRMFPAQADDRKKWILGGAAAAGVLTIGALVMALWPSAPAMATLDITLDKPAVISVDGKREAPTQRATVKVQPGKAHVVTVEYGGKIVRTVNVPSMAPNEEVQLNVIVR